jgi:titin
MPPAAPTRLSTRARLSGASASVTLVWRDNADDETTFEVQRSGDGRAFTTLATPPANTTTFADTTVARRTTYWYRVRAVNAAGASAFSNTASVKTK